MHILFKQVSMVRIDKTTIAWMLSYSVIFLIFNFLTPLFADDWNDRIYGTTDPVASIKDVFDSGKGLYFLWSGRVIPHICIQFFNCITGKSTFNVVNALFFMLFLYGAVVNANAKRGQSNLHLLTLTVIFLFLFMPGFARCCLWLCGACNYLWVGSFILLFNFLLRKDIKKNLYPLLFVFAILCGWSNEGIVLGFAVAYFMFAIRKRKTLSSSQKVMLSGFYIGVLLLLSSPANVSRFMSGYTNHSNSIKELVIGLTHFSNLRITFIMLIACVFACRFDKRKYLEFGKKNQTMLIALLTNWIFLLSTKHTSDHSRFGIELCALIILLDNLPTMRSQKILTSLNVLLTLYLCSAIPTLYSDYKQYKRDIYQLQNGETVLLANDRQNIYSRFVLNYMFPTFDDYYDSYHPESWQVSMIAQRLGTGPFIRIPESLVIDMMVEPKYEHFSTDKTSTPLYAMRATGIKEDQIGNIVFILRQKNLDGMNLLERCYEKYVRKSDLGEVPCSGWSYVVIGNQPYILAKKSQFEDSRIIDVQIRPIHDK